MGTQDVTVTKEGGCGAGCIRTLLLLWFFGGVAVVVGLPLVLGGTNGAGGAAVGLLGSGALVAALWLPWIIGVVVLAILNFAVRPSKTVIVHQERTNVVGPPSHPISTVQDAAGRTADSKVCPRCAETVKAAARVCRFCGYNFDIDVDEMAAGTRLVAHEMTSRVASAGNVEADESVGEVPDSSARITPEVSTSPRTVTTSEEALASSSTKSFGGPHDRRAESGTNDDPSRPRSSTWRGPFLPLIGAGLVLLTVVAVTAYAIGSHAPSNPVPTPDPSLEGTVPAVSQSPADSPAILPATSSPVAMQRSSDPERVAVATAACPNPYGPLPGEGTPPPNPDQVVVSVPTAWSQFFTAYRSNGSWLLAPQGWLCQNLDGGGSGSTTRVGPLDDPNALVSIGYQGSYMGSIDMAAPYFAAAAQLAKQDPTSAKLLLPPSGETWWALAQDAVYFHDDVGVQGVGDGSGGPYVAQGVLVYRGPQDLAVITCVLPNTISTLCPTILNNFLIQEGVKARV